MPDVFHIISNVVLFRHLLAAVSCFTLQNHLIIEHKLSSPF